MMAASGGPAQPADFLANCGELALAFARAAPHERSFLSASYGADDLGAWVEETRERVIDLLHYVPEPCALAPEVLARVECDDYTRESVLISTAPWSRVPCEVLIPRRPRGGAWPAPTVEMQEEAFDWLDRWL